MPRISAFKSPTYTAAYRGLSVNLSTSAHWGLGLGNLDGRSVAVVGWSFTLLSMINNHTLQVGICRPPSAGGTSVGVALDPDDPTATRWAGSSALSDGATVWLERHAFPYVSTSNDGINRGIVVERQYFPDKAPIADGVNSHLAVGFEMSPSNDSAVSLTITVQYVVL